MSVLLYEVINNTGVITLNRPDKRNALNSEMIRLLGEFLEQAKEDPKVKVILIRGAGEKAFTAGFDLMESMEHNITDVVDRRDDTSQEVEFFKKMWNMPKPIISAIQGYCIGGGITISMMSDMIIAADSATFGNPEIVLGYIPEIPVELWKMPMNKAVEWFFMGKFYSAEELREIGVVNEVVPFEKLQERAMEVAEQIARIPSQSMKMMKYSIRKCYDIRGFSNTLDFAAEMFNLGRIHMQQNDAVDFRDDIAKGGLKAALNTRYN